MELAMKRAFTEAAATLRKTAAAFVVATFGLVGIAGLATADHAGESATADVSEGLTDGQTITITVENMKSPGMTTAQIMMANTWPVRGPEAFNLAEIATAPTVEINPDGTGTFEYTVTVDHGTFNCLEVQCHVVIFQGMGFDSYTAGLPVSFVDESATTTTEEVVEETTPSTEPLVISPAPETTADDGGDEGGSAGLIIVIVVVVVVLGGVGIVLAKRRSS